MRRIILVLSQAFVLWLLLANHLIVVPDDPAFVVLKKTQWTFDSSIIGESSWGAFSLHHPILMGWLATGQGLWIIGGTPQGFVPMEAEHAEKAQAIEA